jgi:GNAT superfamily N-acetyltransferase
VRSAIEVSAVRPDDRDGVVELCLRARGETWTASQVCSGDPTTVAAHLGALMSAPGAVLFVARGDDGLVGLLLGRLLGPNIFTDEVNLAVEVVYVDSDHRRRGVGHALMLAAAELGLASGAENVYAAPIPGARGVQRFFVRLGFTPAASHRVIPVTTLHRRLTADGARRAGSRRRDDVIARRRQSRDAAAGSAAGAASAPLGVAASAGRSDVSGLWESPRAAISRQVSRAVQIRREVSSSTTIS